MDKSLVSNFDILNLVPEQALKVKDGENGGYNRTETGELILFLVYFFISLFKVKVIEITSNNKVTTYRKKN